MPTLAELIRKESKSGESQSGQDRQEFIPALLIAAFFSLAIGMWFLFDHRLPGIDESGHIMDSFRYADLLKHPRFWQPAWWHDFLSVNRFYPPFVDIINGSFKVALGPGKWVNVLSLMSFSFLLSMTVYGSARLLTESRAVALLSLVFINIYPHVNLLSHQFLLDFPLIAMVSLGLFSLCWWRSSPSWTRAVVCGVILGLACMSKQIAGPYLFFVGLVFLVEAINRSRYEEDWTDCLQLIAAAAITILVGMPWTLTNFAAIQKEAQYNVESIGSVSLIRAFANNLTFYLLALPKVMSPVLFGAFTISILSCDRWIHRVLFPVTALLLGGLVFISAFGCYIPLENYVTPGLIAAAMITSAFFVQASRRPQRLVRASTAGFIVLVLLQFFSFNFMPYPVAGPHWLSELSGRLGNVRAHACPVKPSNWQQEWVIETIDELSKGKPCWLNVMPCFPEINVHTFELLAKNKGSNVTPTSSRTWSLAGDRVEFDKEKALYFQWYLLKSGRQGTGFADQKSEKAYERLGDFVRNSQYFELVGTKNLPDDSELYLFRQK